MANADTPILLRNDGGMEISPNLRSARSWTLGGPERLKTKTALVNESGLFHFEI